MKHSTTATEMTATSGRFVAYCRTIALGSGPAGRSARLVLGIGGDCTPAALLRKLRSQLASGTIDAESFTTLTEAVEHLAEMHHRGIQTHVTATPLSEWRDLGNNCHQRINHHGH